NNLSRCLNKECKAPLSHKRLTEFREVVDLRFRRTLSAGRGEKQKRLVQPRQAKGKGAGKSVSDLLDTCPFDLEGLAVYAGQVSPLAAMRH
ncbi:hypothetical protein CGZ90_07780, partial [Fictibacillus aquaticus]